MKLVSYDKHLVSTVDTDGLVLLHEGSYSHIADYAPMSVIHGLNMTCLYPCIFIFFIFLFFNLSLWVLHIF